MSFVLKVFLHRFSWRLFQSDQISHPSNKLISRSANQAIGAVTKGEQAINQVGEHVEQQPDSDEVEWPTEKQQNNIACYGVVRVQRMKSNAAPVSLEDGGCQ